MDFDPYLTVKTYLDDPEPFLSIAVGDRLLMTDPELGKQLYAKVTGFQKSRMDSNRSGKISTAEQIRVLLDWCEA